MKIMADRIRFLRQERHMTQVQLAKELGVQFQTVSKWETGTTVPDTAMLPRIADYFGISMDELFGRAGTGCVREIPEDEKEFLLKTYAGMYGPEAGPWNLSVENKYLMYRITDFFENHFAVEENTNICNIGIGAGEWDLYLSYQLKKGSLTSIDRSELCCKQLEARIACEGNPHDIRIVCADAVTLMLDGQFDIVTVVGSTAMESDGATALLEKAICFIKKGGALYYQSLNAQEDCSEILQTAFRSGMKLSTLIEDDAYGFKCRYYRFEWK